MLSPLTDRQKSPRGEEGFWNEYLAGFDYQTNVGELTDLPPAATVRSSPSAQSISLISNLKVTVPVPFEEANAHSYGVIFLSAAPFSQLRPAPSPRT